MVVMVVDGVFPSIEESFLQHEQQEVVQEMEVEIARMTERRERLDWGLDFLPGIFGGDDRPAGVFDADTWEGQFQQLENYAHHDGNAELSKEEMEDFFFGEDGPDWAPGHGQEFYQDDAMSDAKYELWQRMGGGEEGSIDDLWDSLDEKAWDDDGNDATSGDNHVVHMTDVQHEIDHFNQHMDRKTFATVANLQVLPYKFTNFAKKKNCLTNFFSIPTFPCIAGTLGKSLMKFDCDAF